MASKLKRRLRVYPMTEFKLRYYKGGGPFKGKQLLLHEPTETFYRHATATDDPDAISKNTKTEKEVALMVVDEDSPAPKRKRKTTDRPTRTLYIGDGRGVVRPFRRDTALAKVVELLENGAAPEVLQNVVASTGSTLAQHIQHVRYRGYGVKQRDGKLFLSSAPKWAETAKESKSKNGKKRGKKA